MYNRGHIAVGGVEGTLRVFLLPSETGQSFEKTIELTRLRPLGQLDVGMKVSTGRIFSSRTLSVLEITCMLTQAPDTGRMQPVVASRKRAPRAAKLLARKRY